MEKHNIARDLLALWGFEVNLLALGHEGVLSWKANILVLWSFLYGHCDGMV